MSKFGEYIVGTVILPEDYLKRYKWFQMELYISQYPLAMITYRDHDVWIKACSGAVQIVEPKTNPELYYLYNPATKQIIKYAKLWAASGFYKSLHLKEFLDQIIMEENGR